MITYLSMGLKRGNMATGEVLAGIVERTQKLFFQGLINLLPSSIIYPVILYIRSYGCQDHPTYIVGKLREGWRLCPTNGVKAASNPQRILVDDSIHEGEEVLLKKQNKCRKHLTQDDQLREEFQGQEPSCKFVNKQNKQKSNDPT